MEVNKKSIENFLLEINELLSIGDVVQSEKNAKEFFYIVRESLSKEEFNIILNEVRLSFSQKDVMIEIYENGKDISDFLSLQLIKLADFSPKEQLKQFEKIIFDKEFEKKIKKSLEENNNINENEYVQAILFLKNEVLPNIKLETTAKYYTYIISELFFEDLKNDASFYENIKNKTKKATTMVENKISGHLRNLRIEKDYSDYENSYVILEENRKNLEYDDFKIDNFLKNSPSGYFDSVMLGSDNKLYVVRSAYTLPELDQQNHLKNRLHEENSLKILSEILNVEVVLIDFYKGHNNNFIKKIIKEESISEDKLNYIKPILDKILHMGVSDVTGIYPSVIQISDGKYNIEKNEFLDSTISLFKFYLEEEIDFRNNRTLIELTNNALHWLNVNFDKNLQYHTKDNLEKSTELIKLADDVISKYSINDQTFEENIDLLDFSISNTDFKKNKIMKNMEISKIKNELNILKTNPNSLLKSKDYYNDYINISNKLKKEFIKIVGDFTKTGNLSRIAELERANNAQYEYLYDTLEYDFIKNKKIPKTLQNNIKTESSVLLNMLNETKEEILKFSKYASIKSSNKIITNLKEIENFLNNEGELYNHFSKINNLITKITINGYKEKTKFKKFNIIKELKKINESLENDDNNINIESKIIKLENQLESLMSEKHSLRKKRRSISN